VSGYAWPVSGTAAVGSPPGRASNTWRTAELLCALAYGSGMAAAERMEHGTNTAFVGAHLGRALGVEPEEMEAVFYGALLKDVGCGACGMVLGRFYADDELGPGLDLTQVDLHSPRSVTTWAMGRLRLDPSLPARLARLAAFAAQCGSLAHEAMASHCEIAADFAAGLGFGRHVQEAVHNQYERYDGRGAAFHRRAEAIPRSARILHVALAADLVRGLSGPDAAAAMVRGRAGSYFDPDVAEAYLDLGDSLWPADDGPIPLSDVLSCDPGTSVNALPGDRRVAVCEALADFADLKSARRGRHSRTVANLASHAATQLGFAGAEQERIYRAGLVHDIGKIAVPYRMLQHADNAARAPADERKAAAIAEPVRLHPHYGQRILSRVHPLADLAADVSAHHERLDGSGYPLGLAGRSMSPSARLLAAADLWAERAANGTPDLAGEKGLDQACVAALRSSAQSPTGAQRQDRAGPPARSALTSRELEVLRLLADGASNPDISKTLSISRRTAEHHVEHILAKLNVTSRTGAVAYALTHELLP